MWRGTDLHPFSTSFEYQSVTYGMKVFIEAWSADTLLIPLHWMKNGASDSYNASDILVHWVQEWVLIYQWYFLCEYTGVGLHQELIHIRLDGKSLNHSVTRLNGRDEDVNVIMSGGNYETQLHWLNDSSTVTSKRIGQSASPLLTINTSSSLVHISSIQFIGTSAGELSSSLIDALNGNLILSEISFVNITLSSFHLSFYIPFEYIYCWMHIH